MSYVIEDGVPLPLPRGSASHIGPRTVLTKFLDVLKPGQSLLTQDPKDYKAAEQFAIRSRPKRFAFRKLRDGWRVWRIE